MVSPRTKKKTNNICDVAFKARCAVRKADSKQQEIEPRTVNMTLYECFGYGLMGFGPALSMFVLTISSHPSRIVILLASSFGWLLSLLLSSLAWLALSPLGAHLALGAALAVFFQEAARFMTLRALCRIDKMLNLAALAGPDQLARSRVGLAYASGLGFGVASGACFLLNILADAAKMGGPPGLQGITDSVPYSFFLVSALTASVLVVLHTAWSVISFQAMSERNPALLAFPPVTHLFASAVTLLYSRGDYGVPLAALVGLLFITAAVAFSVAGAKPGPAWAALGVIPRRGSPEGAEDETVLAET